MTAITILIFAAYIAGMAVGAFAVWVSYRAKEREQEAVLEYIKKEKSKTPPLSPSERVSKALLALQPFVTSYKVKYRDETWTYKDE